MNLTEIHMYALIKKLREIRDYCDAIDDQPLDRIDEELARTHDAAITHIRDMAECAIEDAMTGVCILT